jgi:hypothetical protein
MTDGFTLGDLILLHLPRSAEFWLVMKMSMSFTNGFGKVNVKPSIKFSFGFLSKIG